METLAEKSALLSATVTDSAVTLRFFVAGTVSPIGLPGLRKNKN
jgi:hypothetical protein